MLLCHLGCSFELKKITSQWCIFQQNTNQRLYITFFFNLLEQLQQLHVQLNLHYSNKRTKTVFGVGIYALQPTYYIPQTYSMLLTGKKDYILINTAEPD